MAIQPISTVRVGVLREITDVSDPIEYGESGFIPHEQGQEDGIMREQRYALFEKIVNLAWLEFPFPFDVEVEKPGLSLVQ